MEKNKESTFELIELWCQQLEKGNTQELITTLQDISNKYRSTCKESDDKLQNTIRRLISRSTNSRRANQVILSSSLRTYFHVLHQANAVDSIFQDLDANQNLSPFILYAMLSTDYHKSLEQTYLQDKCLEALYRSTNSSFLFLVPVLRAFNLLFKKYNISNIDISIETFYSCLQSNRFGARDEALIIFQYCTTNLQKAAQHFNLITKYWPWTNKNKYYLLSVILTNHNLKPLSKQCDFNDQHFFNGLRLGLSYKSTFSASQSLVRALSKQHNHQLLELSKEILLNGTEREIVNFHTQWFSQIIQKDELYRMLNLLNLKTISFRFIFLTYLFSRQISLYSKSDFNKLAHFLHDNCYQLTIDTQMHVFRFFVDNLSCLEFSNCLEFLIEFIETHRCTDCPQVRHMILGKFPIIFNFFSKIFCSLKSDSYTTIRNFFRRFFQMINRDISATSYQPLIFALKALDRILQILFSSSSKNISKACKIEQNQKLGEYLVKENIFNVITVNRSVLGVLNSSECYDDARELAVNIIKQLRVQTLREVSRRCAECSESIEIDEVAQSAIFARLCVHCCHFQENNSEYSKELLTYSIRRVRELLKCLEEDPLYACKNEGHIFGHVSVINEVLNEENSSLGIPYENILEISRNVINLQLDLLNAAAKETSSAASFQVMDESLQMLINKSKYESKNTEECRKFLMLSFWMALKACCEMATTIGRILVDQAESDEEVLKLVDKCLNISVTVLLRCRHKGAIEAAGVSLGKLIRLLTTHTEDSKCYGIVFKCLDLLFDKVNQISTTRRGAGLTIMFLHLVKNEFRRERPLSHRAIEMLLYRIENSDEVAIDQIQNNDESDQNFDSVHALVLHYLCVIVRDTEMRDTVSEYYDEIMMAAILRIDNTEWTICNAALQLFGALVPKVVGQRQATEMDEKISWEPTEVTFMEVNLMLPRTCEHILSTCCDIKKSKVSTRKLILFLEFLSKVEHLRKGEKSNSSTLERFRELFWSLISHECEKVRKLGATCFVRAHDFREDLPEILQKLTDVLFKVHSENFFQGLVFVFIDGIHKIHAEWLYTSTQGVNTFLESLRNTFRASYKYRQLSFYTRALLIELFLLMGFNLSDGIVSEMIQREQKVQPTDRQEIGFDLWREKVLQN